ncbi:unnamed protein product [Umbelopsis sp. WA50703]
MSQTRPSPSKMQAWRLNQLGPFDETLRLVPDIEVPSEPLRAGQILVRVASAGLNPVDYKFSEASIIGRALLKFPRTPGMDLSGVAVSVGPGVTDIKAGDKVLARIDLTKDTQGALSEYVSAPLDGCAAIPISFDCDEAAAVPTASLSAIQSIAPYVKSGSRVFINGGSGGVGSFGIQIAKILGCHVTTTCSTAKVSLCTELGADEVIDYRTTDVVDQLKQGGPRYDLIVDNVGNSISELFSACSDVLVPEGKFVCVAVKPNFSTLKTIAKGKLLPRFLGGTTHKLIIYATRNNHEDLVQIVQWIAEKGLRSIIDSTFKFENAPEAYKHLKKGSSAGKVVVRVADLL